MQKGRGSGRFAGTVARIVVALVMVVGKAPVGAAGEVERENLRPGLVTTYRDAGPQGANAPRSPAVEIVQLEPRIALALKAGEAAHPRLAADGGTIRWDGYLNVLRAGNYRFAVTLRGKFRLVIGGKEVLSAESHADLSASKQGRDIRFDAGVHPLVAEFTRLPGTARLELFWESPYFHSEPLPYDQLGHLPKQVSAKLVSDKEVERGRFLAEEHSCIRCHQPADADRLAKGLAWREGPDLSQIGKRAPAGWLYHWLEAPDTLRPGASMPRMFADDAAGRVERYAVTRYLASLGGPLRSLTSPQKPNQSKESIERGRRLFTSIGCVACHLEAGSAERGAQSATPERSALPAPRFALSGLGSKTTPEQLAAYLRNPLAIDPSGRMPSMLLQPNEATDLARYLCEFKDPAIKLGLPKAPSHEATLVAFKRVDSRAEELTAFQDLPAETQWTDLGNRIVIAKGCNNCHTIAPDGKPFANVLASADFDDIKKPPAHERGCLAIVAANRGSAPAFAFTDPDRKALRRFLREGTSGAGSPAPVHAARVTLQRFNCLACHARDGEGGLSPALVEELRRYEKADNAEMITPPPLTGIGRKLRTAWIRQVLAHAGRARPWMGLRMPQFGDKNVGHLPEALAALDGTVPDDAAHQVPLSSATLKAGRQLAGKSGFACTGCHDIAGHVSTGTRGPDLASMNERVRYDWYRRWLQESQRMQPGTRMPTVFPDGKSLLTEVLGGNADAQAAAMWAYLSLGPNLPLPDGLEPPKGLVLAVKDRPVLLRTFMPDAGSRALAVGYPGGVSIAFDSATCRLAYAWSGNFLDASPVWNDRGGNPAHVLGPRFWTAPPGCPWGLGDSQAPPDFATRAKDPAYGAALPEGKLYQGQMRLHFEGYRIEKDGRPSFRYRIGAKDLPSLEVREWPEPLESAAARGLSRRFQLKVPGQQAAWLFAGEATGEPRVLNGNGDRVPVDRKAANLEFAVGDRLLVLPQGNGVVVLLATAAPDGTRWQLRRQGTGWQVLLRLPNALDSATIELRLNIWAPYRDDPGLLKELAEKAP
ncbi:MAG TPA: hypothetical protein VKI65_16785 [Gemmataceae bacterium]|nr:hypothetical protein [Gemmataceae bacterium]